MARKDSNWKTLIAMGLLAGLIQVATGIVYAIYNIISISFFYSGFLDEMIRLNAAMRERITANTIAVSNAIRLSVLGTILSVFASLMLKRGARPAYTEP